MQSFILLHTTDVPFKPLLHFCPHLSTMCLAWVQKTPWDLFYKSQMNSVTETMRSHKPPLSNAEDLQNEESNSVNIRKQRVSLNSFKRQILNEISNNSTVPFRLHERNTFPSQIFLLNPCTSNKIKKSHTWVQIGQKCPWTKKVIKIIYIYYIIFFPLWITFFFLLL